MVSYYEPNQQLLGAVRQLLTNFKRELGEQQWNQRTHSLMNSTKKILTTIYGV